MGPESEQITKWPMMLLFAAIFCAYAGLPSRSAAQTLAVAPALAPGSSGDTTADAVLGQVDFVHTTKDFVDGRGVNLSVMQPLSLVKYGDVAIDKSISPNRVYVADDGNSRVLGWSSINAFVTHAAADIVIGQPDFNSNLCNNNGGPTAASLCFPKSVAVDGAGRLYVADLGNNRVTEYNAPFTTDRVADDVFGQIGLFNANYCNMSQSITPGPPDSDTLCQPTGVGADSAGNIYVADSRNNRVLEFNTPEVITAVIGSGDTSADRVFGQLGDFTTSTSNKGGLGSSSLSGPQGVGIDSAGNVYIADTGNNRVTEYDTPLTKDTVADRAFGQFGFGNAACNKGGAVSASSLCTPVRVAIDSVKSVYVADLGNNRVVEYDSAPTLCTANSGPCAKRVFGQAGSLAKALCNDGGVSASSLCTPAGIAVDGASPNNLYVADSLNNRVLKFNNPIGTDTVADGVVAQTFFTTAFTDYVDGHGFDFHGADGSQTGAIAIDASVSPNRVYVADTGNNRVLAWNDVAAFTTHAAANLVFGQPNFFVKNANSAGVTASTLSVPRGVAVDSAGNLYVADTDNNRVLEYNTPFTVTAVAGSGDTVADRVLGQSTFTAGLCNRLLGAPSSSTLCFPLGVALDSASRIYVADFGNDRVLEFDPAPTLCTKGNRCANRVFGQGGSFTADAINNGGESPNSLWNPFSIALDRSSATNHLYVADYSNHRVLEYDSPLTSATANRVFGQSTFGGPTNCNRGGAAPAANTLCFPNQVTVDGAGNLYVSDLNNSRVLKYVTPLADATADRVFGQGGPTQFTAHKCNIGPNGLCTPGGITTDGSRNLYAVDANNYRILEFKAP